MLTVKEAVLRLIPKTAEKDLEHVEGLALALKEHAGTPAPWQAKFEAAAAAVAGAAVKRVSVLGGDEVRGCLLGSAAATARARATAKDMSLALVVKMLAAFPGCAEQEDVLACQRMARARAEALRGAIQLSF